MYNSSKFLVSFKKWFFRQFLGNIGFRFCTEGSTTTAPEAPYPAARAGRSAYPVSVALLRRRRQLHVRGHVETPHDPLSKSHLVCFYHFQLFSIFLKVFNMPKIAFFYIDLFMFDSWPTLHFTCFTFHLFFTLVLFHHLINLSLFWSRITYHLLWSCFTVYC